MHNSQTVQRFSHLWKNLWRVWKNRCYQQLFCLFEKSAALCIDRCINMAWAVASVCYVAGETGVFFCQTEAKSFTSCQNRQRKPSLFPGGRKIFVEIHQKFRRYVLAPAGDTVPKQKNGGTPCPVKWKSAVSIPQG